MEELDKIFNQAEIAFRYYQRMHPERNYEREAARKQFRQDSNIDKSIIKGIVEEASRPFNMIERHFILNRRPTGESMKHHGVMNPFISERYNRGNHTIIKAGIKGVGTIQVVGPEIGGIADSPDLEYLTIEFRSVDEYVILHYKVRRDSAVEGYYIVRLNSYEMMVEAANKIIFSAGFIWDKQGFLSKDSPRIEDVKSFIGYYNSMIRYRLIHVLTKPLPFELGIKISDQEDLLYKALGHPEIKEVYLKLADPKTPERMLFEAELNINHGSKPQLKGVYTIRFFDVKKGNQIRDKFLECFNGEDSMQEIF